MMIRKILSNFQKNTTASSAAWQNSREFNRHYCEFIKSFHTNKTLKVKGIFEFTLNHNLLKMKINCTLDYPISPLFLTQQKLSLMPMGVFVPSMWILFSDANCPFPNDLFCICFNSTPSLIFWSKYAKYDHCKNNGI